MPALCRCRLSKQIPNHLASGNRRLPYMRPIQPQADRIERVNVDPFSETRLIAEQAPELGVQRMSQRLGEGGEQNARFRIRPRQVSRPVQRHDRLARSGRSGDTRRAIEVALHQLALLGMQKDRPLLPRKLESALQLFEVLHDPEAPLGVGMLEGAARGDRLGDAWAPPGGELQ